jgi:mono/diheme cytochrome c family protein
MRQVGLVVALSPVLFSALLGAADVTAARKPVPPTKTATRSAATFETAVSPILSKTCRQCHNDRLTSGDLNLVPLLEPSSLTEERDQWETILDKLRAGEMPPPGVRRPPQADLDALVAYVEGEFEKADRRVPPDPGRVTARRLNRSEYSHTVRDLLGVDFRAEKDFPTDDSSHGFDTIGNVLSVSPVLMEKYLSAAERIASTAIGIDPLPEPVAFEANLGNNALRRVSGSARETTHRFDFDADYTIKVHLTGRRPPESKPLVMGLYVDGKLLKSVPVEHAPAKGTPQEQDVETRLFLAAGTYTIRAAFIDDEYGQNLSARDRESVRANRLPQAITITGPLPTEVDRRNRRRVLTCDPNTGSACVEKIVASLARRAYRRPATKSEVAALLKFVALARAQGLSPERGIQLAIQAMLVSPKFLFRVEEGVGPTSAAGIRRLSDVELASRLSYFLWSSMPDEALLRVAEAGKLRAPGVLHAQVRRMLADPKSAALTENFAGQWLELRNLEFVSPDARVFPEWGLDLRDAMATETRMFFEYTLRENRPLSDYLDAKYTFVNERLAKHYDIPGVTGQEFRKVDLATDQRGGLLGQGSVLTLSSFGTRTSTVLRGKFVLENILGTPPPPPPPDVPVLNENAVGFTASLRQQMEEHRSNPICASCHARMDPLGFGLENYDGIGMWRTMDGKFPIDASGVLPDGRSFSGPTQLRKLLMADLPRFARSLTQKMLTYALGRGLEPFDRRTVADIERKLAADDYRFQTMVFGIVDSIAFQMRHGETGPAASMARMKETDR